MDELKNQSKDHEVFEIRSNSMATNYFDAEYVLPWNIENLKKRNQSPGVRAILIQFHIAVDYVTLLYKQLIDKNGALVKRIEGYIHDN